MPDIASQINNMLAQADKVDLSGPLYDSYTAQALRKKAGILVGDSQGQTTGPNPPYPVRSNPNALFGQIVPPGGHVFNALTALAALHQDTPHYIGGQEVKEGMAIPWGKPGKIPQEQLDQWINQRNRLYHATQPESAERILEQGKINPSDYWASFENDAPIHLKTQHANLQKEIGRLGEEFSVGYTTPGSSLWDAQSKESLALTKRYNDLKDQQNKIVQDWRNSPEVKKIYQQNAGVSISRVPKAKGSAYGSAPVTFELDPTKVPANRPFSEIGYQKTKLSQRTPMGFPYGPQIPNPRFEFENRTYNQPIPASAITKAMIDKSVTPEGSILQSLVDTLKGKNITIEQYETAPEMHSYRARIGEDVKRRLLEKSVGTGQ